ncbi:MAG: hypothetical protein Q8L05_08090 [Actinomycetota bacterium]|nr:hypothetical protein [Actinomycetota bacterium]MDP2288808.1 hypothetical protein [Actinomycetota bacterium]
MRFTRTAVPAIALGLALTASLAACSSNEPSEATSSASATPSMSESAEVLVGGDPSTWSPVRVTPDDDGSTQALVIGQAVIFEGFQEGATFESSDPMVFTASDAQGDGESTTVAGGQALAAGTSEVIARDGTMQLATITFVVTAQ